jgi:4'-phosphopantetheinyl transferase EntD
MEDSIIDQSSRLDTDSSMVGIVIDLLALGMVLHTAKISECEGELYEEELHYIHNAVGKRKREFTAGRICARKALEKLNRSPCSIPVGSTREPLWPQGVAGSITHDGNHCVACVANRDIIPYLGIDLAVREPLDRNLIPLICTKDDIENIKNVGESNFETDPYKLIFSIKESVYKCLFPVVQQIFDFQDVSVHMKSKSGTTSIILLNNQLFSTLDLELKVKFRVIGDYVFSIVWV